MIYLVLYALFCIAFAKLNQVLIDKGKRIYHAVNGGIHIASAVVAWFIYKDWRVCAAVLLIARLVFDTALSVFRKLPFDYVSADPKSWVDKAEKFVFKNNGWLPKLIYLIAIIILIVWHGKAQQMEGL